MSSQSLELVINDSEALIKYLSSKGKSRVIFFVGAFGPFHIGHFNKAYLASLYFDAVTVIVPIEIIPHKPNVMPYNIRLKIIEESIKNKDNLLILKETSELNSDNFMLVLKNKRGLEYIFSLVGVDSFIGIPNLSCGNLLFDETHIFLMKLISLFLKEMDMLY